MTAPSTIRNLFPKLLLLGCLLIALTSIISTRAYAAGATSCPTGYTADSTGTCRTEAYTPSKTYRCGENGPITPVYTSIDIGCKGEGNPITDATFAIIRFLSDGVGLVVIGSIIFGGIQYTASRGDPQATALAIGRIRSSLFALLIFVFGYAILNYLIPAGFLK